MFVVDTNILIYAADRDSQPHVTCRALLDEWRRSPAAWYLTWGICYEFLRVVTHPKAFTRPWSSKEAWQFLDVVLESPGIGLLVETGRHAAVAAEVMALVPHLGGNLWHDAHTAVLMREHGIRRIMTRDTDFHRFKFIEPIDPLTPPGR